MPAGLDQLAGVHDLVLDPGQDGGSRVRCEVDSDQLETLLRVLVAAGVRTLVSQPPTLEELFLRHYSAGADTTGPGLTRFRPGRRGRERCACAACDPAGAGTWARRAGPARSPGLAS